MVSDQTKQARIEEVQALLNAFSQEHLSPDLSYYVHKLWEQIGRKRNYVITGGRKEVWASAVVYVIARLNFLFDRSNPHYMTPDVICDFFWNQEINGLFQGRTNREGVSDSDRSRRSLLPGDLRFSHFRRTPQRYGSHKKDGERDGYPINKKAEQTKD